FQPALMKSNLAALVVAPTLSYRLTNWLSIGISLHLIQITLADNDGLNAGAEGGNKGLVLDYSDPNNPVPLPPPNDTLTYEELFSLASTNDAVASSYVDVDNASGYGWGGSIGILLQPLPFLSLGASYIYRGKQNPLKGKAYIDASKSLSSIESDPDVKAITGVLFSTLLPNQLKGGLTAEYNFRLTNIKLPDVLNLGLAIKIAQRLLLAADFRYIRWAKVFKKFRADLTSGTNQDINAIVGSNRVVSTTYMLWKDQYVIALGLEAVALRSKEGTELLLQIGYNYGNSPSPTKTLSVGGAQNIQHHLTFGVRLVKRNWMFALSYVHAFTEKIYVSNSLSLPEANNTSIQTNQDTLFLGFTWQF
ncbi:MAG: hypothetical protein D6805_01620, partial [Planctomycetota bacterium]